MGRILFVRNEDRVPDMAKIRSMFGVRWLPDKRIISTEAQAKAMCLASEGCIGILETQFGSKGPNAYSLWRVSPAEKAAAIRTYLSNTSTYIQGTRREVSRDGRKVFFLYMHDDTTSVESFFDASSGSVSEEELQDTCKNAVNIWEAKEVQRKKDYDTRKTELRMLRDYVQMIPDLGKPFSKPWLVPWEGSTQAQNTTDPYRWKYRWKGKYAYDIFKKGYELVNHDQNEGLKSGGEHLTYDVILAGVHCDNKEGRFSYAEMTNATNKSAMANVLNEHIIKYDKAKFEPVKKYVHSDALALFKPYSSDDITLENRTMAERNCSITDRRVHAMQVSKTSGRQTLENTWLQDIQDEIDEPFQPRSIEYLACNECKPILNYYQSGGESLENVIRQTMNCINNYNKDTSNSTSTSTNPTETAPAKPNEVDLGVLGKVDEKVAWFGGGTFALSSLCSCCLVLILLVWYASTYSEAFI